MSPAASRVTRWMGLRIPLLGIFWGMLVAAMETVQFPLADDLASTFLAALASQVAVWSIVGIVLVALVEASDERLATPMTFAGFLFAMALAASALASALFAWGPPWLDYASWGLFPSGRDAFGAYLYQAWIVAFYGGLYACAHMLLARSERQRARLARAHDARIRSEAALAQAQLNALRGHVDPGFLLRVLSEVERHYASSPAAGDRLMRRLVAFLRLAMPGIRSGRSTLATELALLRAHDELVDAMAPGTARHAFDLRAARSRVAFPSLLLLPLAEQLARRDGALAPLRVSTSAAGGTIELVLERAGSISACLDDDLLARVQVGMAGVFGTQWSMRTQILASCSRFTLTFPHRSGIDKPPLARETTCPTPTPTSFAAL